LKPSCSEKVVAMLYFLQDRVIKQNLIRSVELIGQAMHPSHLKTNFNFTQRNSLLQHMKVLFKIVFNLWPFMWYFKSYVVTHCSPAAGLAL
jgi:hypothetical protein